MLNIGTVRDPVTVVGRTVMVAATPPGVVPSAAYTSGDAIGGLLAFEMGGSSGIIQTVVLIDLDKEALSVDLVLFDQPFTPSVDNAVFDPPDADADKCIGHISIGSFSSFNDWAVGTAAGVGLAFALPPGQTQFWAQLVARGAQNLSSALDYRVKVVALVDA